MFLFVVITIFLLGGFVFLLVSSNTKEIVDNWPKYRCSPTIMPFAGLYGYDAAENFNFCTKSILNGQADVILQPFTGILGGFIGTLATLIQSANSMRVQLATLVGGVTKITQEFQDRITQIMFRTQLTASRMKMLMGRLFGVFYATIFLGMSGITAVTNFGDTFLFKFLDTFCFPPETLVNIEGYEQAIPISNVKIGDCFKGTEDKITAVFSFYSDGQRMVEFPNGLQVSTNHYIEYQKQFIQAGQHPEAKEIAPWTGGYERPLICLNTSTHNLPIGGYTFLDYDETEEGDQMTMKWIEQQLNNKESKLTKTCEYSPSVSKETKIRVSSNKIKQAHQIQLGEKLSTGRVIGVIKKIVTRVCELEPNEYVGEATLVWCTTSDSWIRASELYPVKILTKPHIFYSFIVTPTAQLELSSGHRIRDYLEVHSPESEQFYAKKITEVSCYATTE